MKLLSHAALLTLWATSTMASTTTPTLLRGGDRLLVERVAPKAPAPPAAGKATPPATATPPTTKATPTQAKKPAAQEEEEEATVVPGKPTEENNEVDVDAEMGVDKFRGARKPTNNAAPAPKVAAPAQQQEEEEEDEEEEVKPVANPKAAPAPAVAPKPQQPVQQQQQQQQQEEEEEEEETVATPKKGGAVNAIAPQGKWWDADADGGLTPANAQGDGAKISMTIRPQENSVRINSRQQFTGGRFEVQMKSASVMPGVVTAIYLASGKGRQGDEATGDQDEIDFEFKGNDPNRVQTNVFVGGQEDLLLVDVGEDTSKAPHTYVLEWDDKMVNFLIDGKNVRSKNLDRALKPMSLHMSVWTTMGGWPGVKKWAGDTNWDTAPSKEIITDFTVISMPTAEVQ